MAISKGDKAPAFTLPDTKKNMVSLDDFNGDKLVIVFFPMAFTSVCTTELCTLRDDYSIYDDLEADIIGISVDSPFTLAKFKEEQNLNFPLLSDFNKTVSKAYGALYDEFVLGMKGVSKRSAFVIDKEGKVAYAEVLENAGDLPSFDNIKETLKALS